jgi:hypothetical protein
MLEKRGWPNYEFCKLYNQVQDLACHLLYKSWFTIRVWSSLKTFFGLHEVEPMEWHLMQNVKRLVDWKNP